MSPSSHDASLGLYKRKSLSLSHKLSGLTHSVLTSRSFIHPNHGSSSSEFLGMVRKSYLSSLGPTEYIFNLCKSFDSVISFSEDPE